MTKLVVATSQFVADLNTSKTVIHDEPIVVQGESEGTQVDIAMQWNESYEEAIYCFTNSIQNKDGGTHLAGFRRLPSFALLALTACAGKAPSGAVTPPPATPAALVERAIPTQAGITSVINNNRADIKKCYQRALQEDNSLTHGRITVTVAIETWGQVKNVEIQGPPQFQSLEPCIKERVGLWSFPQAPEEYRTQFVYVFQGKIGPLERRPTDE